MSGHPPRTVVFQKCKMFNETWEKYKHNNRVLNAFNAFVLHKAKTPLEQFGSKDRPFRSNLVGYVHAALTHDISIIYKIQGRNPMVVQLYAIMSHDESGTGQPASIRTMKSVNKRLDSQTFDDN